MPSNRKLFGHSRSDLVIASLMVTLSMGVSHSALAACDFSLTAGTVVECSDDDSVLPVPGITSVSIIDGSATPQIGVRLLTDGTVLDNAIDITSQIQDPTGRNTRAAFGIATTDIDDSEWSIINSGNVSAVHNGVGQLAAIGVLGDAGEVTVDNSGTLSITRGDITLATNSAGSLTAMSPGGVGTLGNAAAIWIQEEENESLAVHNTGTIQADGKLVAGIFSRGAFLSIENEEDGKIIATGPGSVAIDAHNGTDQEDEDGTHKFFIGNTVIENEGEIQGDVQVVDANGLRYQASRLNEGGGPYDPLSITSQAGRRDSTIVNSGEIEGNIYLGAGNHVLSNTAEGEITGNIDVDQRRTFNYTVNNPSNLDLQVFRAGEGGGDGDDDDDDDEGSQAQVFGSVADFLQVFPDHHFEFDSAGVMTGDVTVHTSADSTVLLKTHITGPGTGSDADNPSESSGFIDGTLSIGTGWPVVTTTTVAATTTLTPVINSTVRDGEAFLVARSLYGTELPTVDEDSFLVDWTAYQVGGPATGNPLAIQAQVKDATEVTGITAPGAAALNALLAAGGENPTLGALGGGVESLSEEDDVRKSAEQLKPDVSYATQQSAITLNQTVGQHIDSRLASAGVTGSFGGYAAGPSGLGMTPPSGLGMTQSDPNRSNLGGSLKDDGEYIAPRSTALWGDAFGAGLNQDPRGGIDGYNSNLYGFLIGYDNWISPNVRLGFAGGYANTNIDHDGLTTQNSTGIDSYLIEAYASYKGGGWYATGRTGFTWHDYDTRRALTIPFADVANGSHDGQQYNAAIEIGAPMHHASSIFTPVASLTYSNLDQDGYTENSLFGMGLNVGSQNNDSLVSGVGLKALMPIASDTLLEGRALWLHEFLDASQVVGASFAAGGGTFSAAGPNVGRDTADLGVGLLASVNSTTTFQLNYDANIRDDFVAHVGSAKVTVGW